MKVKRKRYYRGSRDPLGAIQQLCPDWLLVEAAGLDGYLRPYHGIRRGSDGGMSWHDGPAPAPVGVYCRPDWTPIFFETPGGRVLPNLAAEAEEMPS